MTIKRRLPLIAHWEPVRRPDPIHLGAFDPDCGCMIVRHASYVLHRNLKVAIDQWSFHGLLARVITWDEYCIPPVTPKRNLRCSKHFKRAGKLAWKKQRDAATEHNNGVYTSVAVLLELAL